jgi:hypothetical protein
MSARGAVHGARALVPRKINAPGATRFALVPPAYAAKASA